MIDSVPKILLISGLILDFLAFFIGGRNWVYQLAHGVRAAFAWNARNLTRQHLKKVEKRAKLERQLSEGAGLWTAMRLHHHLAGMRIAAWQVDANNKKHRAQWNLEPRTLLGSSGYLDPAVLELNQREIDNAISERVLTGAPKDISALVFRLFCAGTFMTLLGVIFS